MIKDILIVGCGPSGMYAWKIAVKLKLTGDIIETEETYGGQVKKYYPEKKIHNLPAIFEIKGSDAMDEMFNSINKEESLIDVHFETHVTKIKRIDSENTTYKNWFEVHLSNGMITKYKRVVFSVGTGKFKPKKLVAKDYENIHYSVKDTTDFKDKNILIFGGGDSTVDWANQLYGNTKSISVIHRRDEFRAQIANVEAAKEKGVKFLTPFSFKGISEESGNFAKKVKIQDNKSNDIIELDFDLILVQFGNESNFQNIDLPEIQKKDNKFKVNNKMETSFEGIYAIGDCCIYETKIRSLLAGFYEAVLAIVQIEKIIKNREVQTTGW